MEAPEYALDTLITTQQQYFLVIEKTVTQILNFFWDTTQRSLVGIYQCLEDIRERIYRAIKRHIQEESNIYSHRRLNPKTNNFTVTYLLL